MNFDDIRQLQINERNNSLPQQTKDDLYEEMERLIRYQDDPRIIRSIHVIKNDIKRLRFNKIINNAKQVAESKKEERLPNLTPKEMEFYNNCIDLFGSWYQ